MSRGRLPKRKEEEEERIGRIRKNQKESEELKRNKIKLMVPDWGRKYLNERD